MPNLLKNFLFFAATLLPFFIIYSCDFSKKNMPTTANLNIDFYVRYLVTDKQTNATISFTEIDSTKKIFPKKMEEVLFQGNSLEGKKWKKQFRYQGQQISGFQNSQEFSYRHNGALIKLPTIQIYPILDFELTKNVISKTKGGVLSFEGAPINAYESLVLLFSDSSNKSATLILDISSKTKNINLQSNQLNNLATGMGSMYIVRRQTFDDTNENFQLKGLTEYFTAVKEIMIVE